MGFYVSAQCQELAGLIELGGEKFFCTSAYNQLPKILKSESFRDFAGCSKNCFFNDEEKRDTARWDPKFKERSVCRKRFEQWSWIGKCYCCKCCDEVI